MEAEADNSAQEETTTYPVLGSDAFIDCERIEDIVISAPTGCGKTLCYVLPVLNTLRNRNVRKPNALVVAPVQNLVDQIEKEFKKYNAFGVQIVSLSGMHTMESEVESLRNANIVIATPGRLMEHITSLKPSVDFTCLRFLIVDEADRMSLTARIEWLDALETVAKYNSSCVCVQDLCRGSFMQKILVSATMSLDVEDLSEWRLRHPRLFKATKDEIVVPQPNLRPATIPSSLMVEVIVCEARLKPLAVYECLEKQFSWKKILIFVNDKMASFRLAVLLKYMSGELYKVEELSSNLYGKRRQKVLNRFMKGTTRVLISSDIISRGIDIPDVDVVINYDRPQNERLFIHRVGRTARCGKKGAALCFITSEEKSELQAVLKKIGIIEDVKEESFKSTRDQETEKKYQSALLNLKKVVQEARKIKSTRYGKAKRKPKKFNMAKKQQSDNK